MTSKRKKHEVTPIGFNAANDYVQSQLEAKKKGRRMGDKTSRSLVLILAYGVDAVTANAAANDDYTKDQSAAHQLKWRAIEKVKAMIKAGLKPSKLVGTVSANKFSDIASDVKFMTKCSDQELAAVKSVVCYGAPVDEIESFCDVSISGVVEVALKLAE